MFRYPYLINLFCIMLVLVSCQRQSDAVTAYRLEDEIGLPQLEAPTTSLVTSAPILSPRLVIESELDDYVSTNIISYSREPVGMQMPAYIEAEVVGRNIASIRRVAGVIGEGEQRRLVTNEYLQAPDSKSVISEWADGVHEMVQIWSTEGDYLTDGTNGDFVVLWSAEPGSSLYTVNGQYHVSATSESAEAILVIDTNESRPNKIMNASTGLEFFPSTGDKFQVTNLMLDEQGNVITSPGMSLSIDEVGDISFEKRPFPDGKYFFGLFAESESGETSNDLIEFTVGNDNLRLGFRAFFDPTAGYQFLYPTNWIEAKVNGNQVISGNITDTLHLTISTLPEDRNKPISDLKAQVLASFGAVQILYEDTAPIGEAGSLWTAYGYESADGLHSGVFLVFVQDGQSFVLDVDGLATRESDVIETIGWLSDSWVTRPVTTAKNPGNWASSRIGEYTLHRPAPFRYSELNNGWHRFREDNDKTFIAVRLEDAKDGRILDRIRHWLDVSARNVTDFAYSEIYTIDLAGTNWLRQEFSYLDENGEEIYGSLMAARVNGKLAYVWAEAPTDSFDEFDREILLISLAGFKKVMALDDIDK